MQRIASALFAPVLSLVLAGSALAQNNDPVPSPNDPLPSDPTSPSKPWPDEYLHQNNRVIAFASPLMVANGSDVGAWKAVDTYFWGLSSPLGTVLYTTAYDLYECEDGRAYIVRSGEGIDLASRTEGEIFHWTEGVLCDEGIPEDGMSKTRQLKLNQIKKTFR